MIIAYCFHPGDQELAFKNAKWMNELGGCKGHEVLMGFDKRCLPATIEAIHEELSEAFDKVHQLPFPASIDGWPEGANYFFRMVATRLETKPNTPYFMWLEPDAIPLRPGWADAIENEHLQFKKPFTGDRVAVENIPVHMSGVGVYPLPLHVFAGEAYRAMEVAFDMAGKDQIVPQAHFTKLIEHAWKHPQFTNESEIETQIRKEAVVFHSSKDGSLIDLLRGRKQKGIEASIISSDSMPAHQKEQEEPCSPSPEISCDIFIRTYPGDYSWLSYCLKSIGKFAKGFRKTWVISPQAAPIFELKYPDQFQLPEWKQMNDESEDGYLAQQITKLYADVITDYQADYILHVDSDVILTSEIRPENFLAISDIKTEDVIGVGQSTTWDYKVIWPYTSYLALKTPWQPITEKFMGIKVENEFMRRFPMMIPKWLYPRMREFCHRMHGMTISDYIRNQPHRAFSEFNALGAYAWKVHQDKFAWVNTEEWLGAGPPPCARQFHSYSGITPEVKAEIETILSGGLSEPEVQSKGDLHINRSADTRNDSDERRGTQLPAAQKTLGGGGEKREQRASGNAQPAASDEVKPPSAQTPQIKKLPNDIWVLEGDQISEWVKQEGRLDHDQNLLPRILEHIKEGDTVVDAGAYIGDHAIAYSKAVGKTGRVWAFEPNPVALECLLHNIKHTNNVLTFDYALSNSRGMVPLSGNNGNWGGAYVGEHMKVTDVTTQALEVLIPWRVNFIKIDVEGYELKVLQGSGNLINRCKPKMVIEINQVALQRQGTNREEIFSWLLKHGYTYTIIQENCSISDPLYDILCEPLTKSPGVQPNGEGSRCPSPPPVTSLPSIEEQEADHLIQALAFLKEMAAKNRQKVMLALYNAGLTPAKKYKKKKIHEKPVTDYPKRDSVESHTKSSAAKGVIL